MGEVLRYETYGPHYHSLVIADPVVAAAARPGQFVNVRCGSEATAILRRPFSVARVHDRNEGPVGIEIMFDIRGPGTRYLAERRPGDRLDLLGPLGTGFGAPENPASCLLVGGGIGAAPLFFLADDLTARGHRVGLLLGARRADLLLDPDGATGARCTTEDGSVGDRGRVTDVLPEMIRDGGVEVVYACGPHPMLAAVTRVASENGVRVRVAVEELMACGWGVCMTCVMPVRTGGALAYVRSCTEGPVFDGTEIHWNGGPAGAATELVPAGTSPASLSVPEHPAEHPPPGN